MRGVRPTVFQHFYIVPRMYHSFNSQKPATFFFKWPITHFLLPTQNDTAFFEVLQEPFEAKSSFWYHRKQNGERDLVLKKLQNKKQTAGYATRLIQKTLTSKIFEVEVTNFWALNKTSCCYIYCEFEIFDSKTKIMALFPLWRCLTDYLHNMD